jgi:hypothetical protein
VKIETVEAIPLEIPLNKVFSGSGYRVTSRHTHPHRGKSRPASGRMLKKPHEHTAEL